MSQQIAGSYVRANGMYVPVELGDRVYVVNSRTGKFAAIEHVVTSIRNGIAVTRCDIWARGGTVVPTPEDNGTSCSRCR